MSTIAWLFILAGIYTIRAALKGQVIDADGNFVFLENTEKVVTGLITGDTSLLADPAGAAGLSTPVAAVVSQGDAAAPGPAGGGDSPIAGRWAHNPRTVPEALAWAKQQADSGTGGWYNRCLAFVAQAYLKGGSGTSYAIDIWSQMPEDMRHTDKNYPVGALLLYRTGKRAGHITLYAGNGMCYSNDVKRRGKIDLVKTSDVDADPGGWDLTYVGWTPPYFPHNPSSKADPKPSGKVVAAP